MRWTLLFVVGALLVTIWAHTPLPSAAERPATERAVLVAQHTRTLLELDRLEGAYREHARIDSLRALLPAQPGLTVSLSPALPADVTDSVRAAAERELAAAGPPRARIGVFVIDAAYGVKSDVRRGERHPEREIYVGTDSAGAYCVSVATGNVSATGVMYSPAFGYAMARGVRVPDFSPSALGPCAFVARHGVPGVHIADWLERRRRGLLGDGFGPMWTFAELRDPTLLDDTTTERLLRWSWYSYDNITRGCGAGRRDLCRELAFPEGATMISGPGIDLGPNARRVASSALLYELEQQFGPERFTQFWTSDDSVTVAFAAAFGMDPLDWVRDWARSHYRLRPLGPGVAAGNLLLSLGVVVLLAGIAALVAMRREV